MLTVYSLLKLVHILLAIVAVGFNASYAIWIARAARESQHIGHVLRGIKFLDDRLANPGYGLLLGTGLLMVFVGNWPLTTFWIAAALVLYLIVLVIGLGFYTPTLRRQIAVLDEKGAALGEFQRLSRRATVVGLVTLVPILLILFLMVVKPTQPCRLIDRQIGRLAHHNSCRAA